MRAGRGWRVGVKDSIKIVLGRLKLHSPPSIPVAHFLSDRDGWWGIGEDGIPCFSCVFVFDHGGLLLMGSRNGRITGRLARTQIKGSTPSGVVNLLVSNPGLIPSPRIKWRSGIEAVWSLHLPASLIWREAGGCG